MDIIFPLCKAFHSMGESVWSWFEKLHWGYHAAGGITVSTVGIWGLIKFMFLKPKVDVKFKPEQSTVFALIGQIFNPIVVVAGHPFPRFPIEEMSVKVGISGKGLTVNPVWPRDVNGNEIQNFRLASSSVTPKVFYIAALLPQGNQMIVVHMLQQNPMPIPIGEYVASADTNSPKSETWWRSFRVTAAHPYLEWFGPISHRVN